MIRFLYSTLFHLLLPLIWLRLLWRARLAPEYMRRVRERVGLGIPVMRGGLWVHAVSVGETMAAVPLINAWRAAHPQQPVFISTMTPTGSARVRAQWGSAVLHAYAPYDLPWAWALFLRRVQPSVLVIMETELWPNMIHAAHHKNIPVLLMNARLSARSANGYARAKKLIEPMLAQLTQVAAQDDATAQRFYDLGVSAEKISVTGSVKFDITAAENITEQARQLRASWQLAGRKIVVAASTHAGEDLPLLNAFSNIKKTHKNALLILVPRHPERFDNVATLIKQQKFSLARRSRGDAVSAQTAVLLGDTMGELMLWYALADVAFVGGSLLPVGGHNVLEPMALGVPTLAGPYMFNFQTITDALVSAGALHLVGAENIASACINLLNQPEKSTAQINAAHEVLKNNRGALQKQLALIEKFSRS